jgi:uncharacterized membrane protein YuzA (DUF378 family)
VEDAFGDAVGSCGFSKPNLVRTIFGVITEIFHILTEKSG